MLDSTLKIVHVNCPIMLFYTLYICLKLFFFLLQSVWLLISVVFHHLCCTIEANFVFLSCLIMLHGTHKDLCQLKMHLLNSICAYEKR